jgi:hypothetical protein
MIYIYLPVFASASPFVAFSNAPARGRIVAERAPRGPDGRLNNEYLPDNDDDDNNSNNDDDDGRNDDDDGSNDDRNDDDGSDGSEDDDEYDVRKDDEYDDDDFHRTQSWNLRTS